MAVPLKIPYAENNFTGDANWQRAWGNGTVDTAGHLEIGAMLANTGGGMSLANSSKWSNYIFTATIAWVKGETFTMIADDNGNDNAVKCVFDRSGAIGIYRSWDNGNDQLIGQGTPFALAIAGDVQAFIEVNGTHVYCGIGSGVASSYLSPQLTNGGIGFDAWDPNLNNSLIIVKSLSVIQGPDNY